MLCPEAIGSKSAELIRILLLHSYTHSLTQRDGIVASPPIGGSSHKNKAGAVTLQEHLCLLQQ